MDTIINALSSLYAEPKRLFPHTVTSYYLERWAPHFDVTVERLADLKGASLLTLHRFAPDHFPREPVTYTHNLRDIAESPPFGPKPELVIHNAGAADPERTPLKLYAMSADELCLFVRTEKLAEDARRELARSTKATRFAIWAPAGPSRYDFYRARLEAALPGRNWNTPVFRIGKLALHNPLMHLSRPLVNKSTFPGSTQVAPAHGDLHPGNILVVGTTPVIIDYGLSEPSLPVGVDAARLFGGLVRDVMAECLSVDELVAVVAEVLELASPEARSSPKVTAACRILRKLSDGAKHITDDATASLWPVHLYGFSWIALKWADGSTKAHGASFLLAAIALTKWLGSPEEAPSPPIAPIDTAPRTGGPTLPHVNRVINREGPAEILVLIAKFAGQASYDPTQRIHTALADHVFETIPDLGRVERLEDVISTRKDAIESAKHYDASMIVWGTYDDFGISPHYEITRDSLLLKTSAIQLDQATRSQLAERFDLYITHDLGLS